MGKKHEKQRSLHHWSIIGVNFIFMLLIRAHSVNLVHLPRTTTPFQRTLSPDTERLARSDRKHDVFHIACESVIITLPVTFSDIHTQIWCISVVAFSQDVNRKWL